jgi:hypothetical protein
MKLIVERSSLRIQPESDQDVAFIEDSLRLSGAGDSIALTRVDFDADHQLSHLTTVGRASRRRRTSV